MSGRKFKTNPMIKYLSFGLIYVSYIICYLCRKNYSVWLSGLVQDYGIPKAEASLFGSVMEFSYGVGKFSTGPIVDFVSPSKVLAIAIAASGLANFLLFQGTAPVVDIPNLVLWGFNGFAQASTWPALALIFMNWFKDSPYRGTWYAILSTSQNVGSALTPAALSWLANARGFDSTTTFPGLLGMAYAALLLLLLRDGPSSPVQGESNSRAGGTRAHLRRLLLSPQLWMLGLSYLFLTVIRVGVADWSLVLLREHLGVESGLAVRALVFYEVGGFLGGLASGWVSDWRKKGGEHRIRTFQRLAVGLVALLPLLVRVRVAGPAMPYALAAGFFLIGFCAFGPHMLVGLLSREQFPEVPSLAASLVKTVGQVGGALGEYPVGLVATHYGWGAVGWIWSGCAIAAVLCAQAVMGDGRTKNKKD